MKVLYIDVYFLLNFTVDILAAFFTSRILRVKTSSRRFILIGIIGGLSACVSVLFDEIKLVGIASTILFLFLLGIVSSLSITLIRRIRYVFVYFILELLIGGVVSFFYSKLDDYFGSLFEKIEGGAENRRLLVISLIILIAIGVLRVFIMIFGSSRGYGTAKVTIKLFEKSVQAEAMIDSGNLVRDPMSMRPIIFIKRELAVKIFPENLIELSDLDGLDKRIRKRIRLIPVSKGDVTHVYTGVLPDSVQFNGDEGVNELDLIVAIDKEEGTYNGYLALAPSVLDDYVS